MQHTSVQTSLEDDSIFNESYTATIGQMYTGTTFISYTKVRLIHYQTLSKKPLPGRLTWITFLFIHCRVYCYYFLTNDEFANKNEEFYNPSIKKILVTNNGVLHQLFAGGLEARDIYPELKKYFYRELSNVT